MPLDDPLTTSKPDQSEDYLKRMLKKHKFEALATASCVIREVQRLLSGGGHRGTRRKRAGQQPPP
jgi:hypothetical protein